MGLLSEALLLRRVKGVASLPETGKLYGAESANPIQGAARRVRFSIAWHFNMLGCKAENTASDNIPAKVLESIPSSGYLAPRPMRNPRRRQPGIKALSGMASIGTCS